jgi:hypothetical protein
MVIGFAGLGSDIPSPATMTPEDHFYLQDTGNFWQTLIGMDQARTGAGSQVYSATFTVAGGSSDHDGIVAFFPAAAGGGAPAPGQENARPEVATMTGANGTTLWPFANGTLKVFVDDTDQTGAITAQDGAAGTFTLGFTPFVGEVVTVEYVGR